MATKTYQNLQLAGNVPIQDDYPKINQNSSALNTDLTNLFASDVEFRARLLQIINETALDPNKDPEVTNARLSELFGLYPTVKARLDAMDTQRNEKLSRDGSAPMTGALKFDKGITNFKTANNIAQYVNYPSATGTLKITLPLFSGDFMTMKILGYTYGTENQSGWELLISGNTDGSLSWFSCSAVLTGHAPFSSVRMGIESGKPVILIGTTTTFWSYPHVNISEILYRGQGAVDGWTMAVVSSESGVTIQKTPTLQKLGLPTDGTSPMTGALKFEREYGIASYKEVLNFVRLSSDNVGVLKITLPKSWSDTMMVGKIRVFQYVSNESFELDFGGYAYSGGQWLNTTAKVNGSCPFKKVRFAHDGSKCCILIGDLTTLWRYPVLDVSDFVVSYNGIDGWESGWSASIITSEAGLTNITEAELKGTVPTETVITTGFASGWSGELVCQKNQEGLKTVSGDLTKSTVISGGGDVPFTIPSEFRPTIRDVYFSNQGLASAGNVLSNAMLFTLITQGGVIVTHNTGGATANVQRLIFTISYY